MQSFKNNGEMEKESLKLCEINLEMKKGTITINFNSTSKKKNFTNFKKKHFDLYFTKMGDFFVV